MIDFVHYVSCILRHGKWNRSQCLKWLSKVTQGHLQCRDLEIQVICHSPCKFMRDKQIAEICRPGTIFSSLIERTNLYSLLYSEFRKDYDECCVTVVKGHRNKNCGRQVPPTRYSARFYLHRYSILFRELRRGRDETYRRWELMTTAYGGHSDCRSYASWYFVKVPSTNFEVWTTQVRHTMWTCDLDL